MSASTTTGPCEQLERVCLYALQALPTEEARDVENHVLACAECREELSRFRPVVESFIDWPTDVLRPSKSLWHTLSQRVAAEGGDVPLAAEPGDYVEPQWEEVAAGISCKLLATDAERHRVSMLVRLTPGAEYPPHAHAGVEELHLLDGELWIDDRKLYPGDYNRAEPGSIDTRVWSETGCTCILMTSTRDVLR